MAILPEHRYLAVNFFHDHQAPFLCVEFLDVWVDGGGENRMLLIPCGVFYDDFPMFSPSELAEDADSSASALLEILMHGLDQKGSLSQKSFRFSAANLT